MTEPDSSLLEFPLDFPIKIMGRRVDGFAQAMADLVCAHVPEFDPATMEFRSSAQGNYLGLTVTVRVVSRAQLDGIYRALTAHPMVKLVL